VAEKTKLRRMRAQPFDYRLLIIRIPARTSPQFGTFSLQQHDEERTAQYRRDHAHRNFCRSKQRSSCRVA